MRAIARHIYYATKPFVPKRLRLMMRQKLSRRVYTKWHSKWPIPDYSPVFPEQWIGWPNGKRFAVCITHDVENCIGYSQVNDLLNLDDKMGMRSSFNFVPEGDYQVDTRILDKLKGSGFEVGIHDLHHNGKLYSSYETFCKQAERINNYIEKWQVSGFRSAFMLHNLNWLHHLNISYDASTFDLDPFEPQPEGVHSILPFWVDDKRSSRGGFVELPYTMPQDSTLFLVLKETNIELWKEKLEWIARHGGLMLCICHPDYMAFNGNATPFQYDSSLYANFLKHIRDTYAGEYWQPLPSELSDYVSKNKSCFPNLKVNTPNK